MQGVRSLPVNLIADGTDVEPLVIFSGQGLQAMENGGFFHRLQEGIAFKTSTKGLDSMYKVKKSYDLSQLFFGLLCPDKMSPGNDFSLQQIMVTAE